MRILDNIGLVQDPIHLGAVILDKLIGDLKSKLPFLSKKKGDDDDLDEEDEGDTETETEVSSEDDDKTNVAKLDDETSDDLIDDEEPRDNSLVGKLKAKLNSLKKKKSHDEELEDAIGDDTDAPAKEKKKPNLVVILGAAGLMAFILLSDFGEEEATEPAGEVKLKPREKPNKPVEKPAEPTPTEATTPAETTTPTDATATTTETTPAETTTPTDATSTTPETTPAETTTPTDGPATTPETTPAETTTPADATATTTETPPTEPTPGDTTTENPETPATAETPSTETPSTETPPTDTPVTTSPENTTTATEATGGETTTTTTENPSTDSVNGEETKGSEDNLTEQILKDLENQAQGTENSKPATKTEYVTPPNYENVGRGLVYNCTGKHWACIDGPSYKTCEENASSTKYLNKKSECYPFNVYETQSGCEKMQNRMVSSSAKTEFCGE